MNLFKKLTRFFSLDSFVQKENDTANKMQMFSSLTTFGIFFLLVFSVVEFFTGTTIIAAVLIPISLALFIIVFISKRVTSFALAQSLSVILLMVACLYLAITSDSTHQHHFLISLFIPIYVVLIVNEKKAIIASILFFFILGSSSFFPDEYNLFVKFELEFILTFALIYTSVLVGTSFFEYSRVQVYHKHEADVSRMQGLFKEKDDFIKSFSYHVRTPLSSMLGILDLSKNDRYTTESDVVSTMEATVNNLVTTVNHFADESEQKLRHIKQKSVNFSVRSTVNNLISLLEKNKKGAQFFNIKISENVPEYVFGSPGATKQILLAVAEMFSIDIRSNKNTDLRVSMVETNVEGKIKIIFNFKSTFDQAVLIKLLGNTKALDNILKSDSNLVRNMLQLIDSTKGSTKGKYVKGVLNFEFDLLFMNVQKGVKTETVDKTRHTTIPLNNQDDKTIADVNILLVEDNKLNQKIILLSLNKLVKNIDVAENGKQALQFFDKTRYDVILMDIQMPVMDGYRTTEKIREAEHGTDTRTPIIAITANALSGDREKCITVGMDDYISKPFQITSVIDRIKFHIGG